MKEQKLCIPYGAGGLETALPAQARVYTSRIDELPQRGDEDAIVREAMKDPIGSEPLWKLARGKKNAVVIVSDHTRPVPSRHILPFMLEELRRENPEISITLLVATGCHRGTTPEELEAKLGRDIAQRERIVVHDCEIPENNIDIGVLPSGAHLIVDKVAAEADLLVAEGFIEPHFFAGYSGGRKSVLPGICDRVTVHGNHCAAFIDSPFARTGILKGNPIHRDMEAAARMAGLTYIVNVIIDEEKRVVAAFAGDALEAHAAGCAFLAPYCTLEVEEADIILTSNGGAPLDQNLYQAVKGMTAAEAAAAPGAILILCAECMDGTGGESFYHALAECASPAALLEEIRKIPMDKTVADQWQYQILARVLEKHRVILVTRPELRETVAAMKMEYAASPGEALERALAAKGKDARIAVIPNGVSVVVKRR